MVAAQIKPLETVYKGYKFRSRTEARWAVYLDTLGIAFEYEKEGFDLGPHGWYLPDFWLPYVLMWAEVKGDAFTLAERAKCAALAVLTGCPVLMLDGQPRARPYMAFWPRRGIDECDYVLSNHRGLHRREHRFYASTGLNRYDAQDLKRFREWFPDTVMAENAAKSTRFDEKEKP